MTLTTKADVVIFGGGVAGLWTRAILSKAGYTCILAQAAGLGAGQTIASQGLIHRGVKYAIPGAGDSSALAAAYPVWEESFAGRADPDLRSVTTLSDGVLMWTTGDLRSRTAAVAAAGMMRSEVRRLSPGDIPVSFAAAPRAFGIYRAEERAIDVPSLVRALADSCSGPLIASEPRVDWEAGGRGVRRAEIGLRNGTRVRLEAAAFVLAAGEGNEGLLSSLGRGGEAPMQRRPLHMVVAHGAPFHLHGHCLGASSTPRITVTSSEDRGRVVWYLGGGIAETGVERAAPDQIAFAQGELRMCLPWVDPRPMRWAAFRIDRAEGATALGRRPAGPVVKALGNVVAVWPTKLALAPTAAAGVIAAVRSLCGPRGDTDVGSIMGLPRPPVAPRPWEREDLAWT